MSIAVGGIVAVGFLDEHRVIVGTHSGLGVFDAGTGTRLERTPSNDSSWYQGDPPWIRYATPDGIRLIPAAGLWGGELAQSTDDGWTCRSLVDGATLVSPGQEDIRVVDPEDVRTFGFSPGGRIFVYATSPTLDIISRD